ncbi:Sporulation kinase E [bacterium HR37]|nr:Sporulation kinase E [bacterium HR37]
MLKERFWASLVLSSITILVSIFLIWELIEKNFFKNLDYKTLHFLYITRGIAASSLLAAWAVWFIWKEKLRYQELFNRIINNSLDAILIYDKLGNVITMNKTARELFCSTGKELRTVWETIPPESKATFPTLLEEVKKGRKLVDHETEKILHDGRKIPVSIGLIYLNGKDGKFIETVRDIREKIALQNKIIEIEKDQLIGKMAEGIAHHMGTPLASMLLRIQMLKEDLPEHTECVTCMQKLNLVEQQIFYTQKVIQRLLRFARRPTNERHSEKVSLILKEGIEIIKPLINKRRIELELHTEDDINIQADSNLLGLVFSDIMMNAIDAMPEGGKLSVRLHRVDKDTAEVLISDTGTGIPADVLPLVFEPFFSTKPSGKGTGLGLFIAKRVISEHGGTIHIESVEGKGTSVFIRLPIIE